MKEILCFGDSMTYGYNPENGGRYSYEERYTGILQKLLGPSYHVVEEGLNGRTIFAEDPVVEGRSGFALADILLESHQPLDLVIVFLGNNDTKYRIHLSPTDIEYCYDRLLQKILSSSAGIDGAPPAVLVITPPYMGELNKEMLGYYGDEAVVKIREVAERCRSTAERLSIPWISAHEYLHPSVLDGIHLTREDNRILAERIAEKISEMMI